MKSDLKSWERRILTILSRARVSPGPSSLNLVKFDFVEFYI